MKLSLTYHLLLVSLVLGVGLALLVAGHRYIGAGLLGLGVVIAVRGWR